MDIRLDMLKSSGPSAGVSDVLLVRQDWLLLSLDYKRKRRPKGEVEQCQKLGKVEKKKVGSAGFEPTTNRL